MDTLTFNAPILLRHLTFSEAKKAPISEINLKSVLEELEMDMERVRREASRRRERMTNSIGIPAVYRTLSFARMRLPRTRERSRTENSLKTHARTR
jgi:hypothetical protein